MLRATLASMLLGLAMLLAVLMLFFHPPSSGESPLQAINMTEETLEVVAPSWQLIDGRLDLELAGFGVGVVTLLTPGIDAQDYPYLHLSLEHPPPDLGATMSLRKGGKTVHQYILEDQPLTDLWIATREFKGWDGSIEAITIILTSKEPSALTVTDISLHPASATLQLRAILSDLGSFAPWKRAQMNTHTGAAKVASFYPVPLVVTLMLLSFVAYGVVVLLSRGRITFSWTVPAMIFLACWLVLDLVWQNRLLRQVAHSHLTFAGLSPEEKLAAGPDAKLYRSIATVKAHINEPDARVMVATSDLYAGMRAAYFLYPLNAYWRLERPELPDAQYLRKGDYILVLSPSRAYAHKDKGVRLPETRMYPAEMVYSSLTMRLLRLK
ncbi:hypothetical protein EYC82_09695 [Halieaceae bacterium IMCC11814]|uniref:Uncharacterized protein n=2 Tax=Candidatus Marimicrobium litorale TaxID=2518991 RepID=A0ABT3T732_9GAMM|nr:hypothetical protein [Candidatus Marimicrobium litorale]